MRGPAVASLVALGWAAGLHGIDAATAQIPLPPERPAELGGASPGSEAPPEAALPTAEAACRDRLAELGATFEPAPAITEGSCGAPHPVRVLKLGDGVSIGRPADMTCGLAAALAAWARDVVAPAARDTLGTGLSGIAVGTVYECRGQNRDPSARLSEHAFANGADIAGFSFDGGRRLAVGSGAPAAGDPGADGRFLAAVRAGACPIFTTVLGPGSEGHADHMHLDMRARSGGYRICQ